jgi:hypothetical protein
VTRHWGLAAMARQSRSWPGWAGLEACRVRTQFHALGGRALQSWRRLGRRRAPRSRRGRGRRGRGARGPCSDFVSLGAQGPSSPATSAPRVFDARLRRWRIRCGGLDGSKISRSAVPARGVAAATEEAGPWRWPSSTARTYARRGSIMGRHLTVALTAGVAVYHLAVHVQEPGRTSANWTRLRQQPSVVNLRRLLLAEAGPGTGPGRRDQPAGPEGPRPEGTSYGRVTACSALLVPRVAAGPTNRSADGFASA